MTQTTDIVDFDKINNLAALLYADVNPVMVGLEMSRSMASFWAGQ